MTIAAGNVNGIRVRLDSPCEWLGRDRPEVVCLQALEAEPVVSHSAFDMESRIVVAEASALVLTSAYAPNEAGIAR